MRLPGPGRQAELEENVIPLINVVFLLLIFFMLAGALTGADTVPVSPPQSVSRTPAEPSEWTVYLSAGGGLALNQDVMDQTVLQQRLREAVQVNPDLKVRLKVDAQLGSDHLLRMMDLLREVGVQHIRLLTVLERT